MNKSARSHLDGADVLGFLALAARTDLELDRLALGQTRAAGLQVGNVHEHVLAALSGDETETSVLIEELHFALHNGTNCLSLGRPKRSADSERYGLRSRDPRWASTTQIVGGGADTPRSTVERHLPNEMACPVGTDSAGGAARRAVYSDAVTELWITNGAGAEKDRMATTTTFVKKALDTQTDLKARREHCAPAAQVLASLGGELGQQVRIHRDDEFALYTVSELLHETADAVVRMGLGGRRRLLSEEEFAGSLDTKVVDQELCDEDARDAGELVERLDDDGSQTHLIAIAPHGGDIEKHTDEQAERVVERLGLHLASAWRAKGWRPDGGAFERWHITSTDLNPLSFPLLASLMSRRFAHAVAFHGFDDEPGVLIGGTAPSELKERLREAIDRVLPARLAVRVALPDERYGGDDPSNLVNRLSPCGGIQIEQGARPREDYGTDIADAVADVFRQVSRSHRADSDTVLATLRATARSVLDRLRRTSLG